MPADKFGDPCAGAGFGLKERAWNDRALLDTWRERWAEMANAHLAQAGRDARIDHRSNAARGLTLEPQNKIGPAAARRAARGEDSERADEHRAIARRNGERLLAEPELALAALTQQQSTFSRQDLARLVHRQTDGEPQFTAVMARVEASPERVAVGVDGRGRARFSTREMVGIEARLIAGAIALDRSETHHVARARRAAVTDPAGSGSLGEEQRLAFLHVTRPRDLAVVSGIAGGGKSTMLGAARQVWEAQGFSVRGAALSGIAAEGLQGSAGIESRTIASWEYAWDAGRETLTNRDVLVVDEAGMIGSRQLGRMVERVRAAGAKLVLVGDAEQLQAIEAGAAFRAIAERVGVYAITEPRRQHAAWQRQATKELASAKTAAALDRYEAAGMVDRHATHEAALAGLVADWGAARQAAPGLTRIILAHERADVRALNKAARQMRRDARELGPDVRLTTELGPRDFAEGDRLYFLRNERELGVRNGTLGTVERIDLLEGGPRLSVRLDAPGAGPPGPDQAAVRRVTFPLAAYADIDHGYAATLHKNQGVTVDHAHVLATPGMDRHLAYVAMSRHRVAAHLHWAADAFVSPAKLRMVLGRERAKDFSLDYDEATPDYVAAYGERRGFVADRPGTAAKQARRPTPPASASTQALVEAPIVWDEAPTPSATVGRPIHADLLRALNANTDSPAVPIEPLLEGFSADRLAAFEARLARRTEAGSFAPPSAPKPAWPWSGLSNARPAAPMLPGIPYRPVTETEIAAVVDADKAVWAARYALTLALEGAYRDPAMARTNLAALEREAGLHAVSGRLAAQPDLLGKLCGRKYFAGPETALYRQFAHEAAGKIGPALIKERNAIAAATSGYRNPIELLRRSEAHEVPGLSERALRAVDALTAAGAGPDCYGAMPWDDEPPRPDQIARAAGVAPVWTAVRADAELHDELMGFARVTDERVLPLYRDAGPDREPEITAWRYRHIVCSAQSLHESHPAFQAYAAAEPQRLARAAAERRAQATHAAQQAEEASRQAEAARQQPQPRRSPRPSFGPSM